MIRGLFSYETSRALRQQPSAQSRTKKPDFRSCFALDCFCELVYSVIVWLQ